MNFEELSTLDFLITTARYKNITGVHPKPMFLTSAHRISATLSPVWKRKLGQQNHGCRFHPLQKGKFR